MKSSVPISFHCVRECEIMKKLNHPEYTGVEGPSRCAR